VLGKIKNKKGITSIDAVTKIFVVVIPKQQAIDIYSTRSKLTSATSRQVKGFDKLLEGLIL